MGRPYIFINKLGDQEKSHSLIEFAKNQNFILNDLMKFNKIKHDQRVINMSDGSKIVTQSCFGIDRIWIDCPAALRPKEEVIPPGNILYFILTGGGTGLNVGAFSWDINNECYYTLETNSGSKKTGADFPVVWETTNDLDTSDIFRYWKQGYFEGISGTVSSSSYNEETKIQTVSVSINAFNGNTVPLTGMSYASQSRPYDINGKVKVGDYIINTSVSAGKRLFAKITEITSTTELKIDTKIFALYSITSEHFCILPGLPMYRLKNYTNYYCGGFLQAPGYPFSGPDTNFEMVSISDYTTNLPSGSVTAELGTGDGKGGASWSAIFGYPLSAPYLGWTRWQLTNTQYYATLEYIVKDSATEKATYTLSSYYHTGSNIYRTVSPLGVCESSYSSMETEVLDYTYNMYNVVNAMHLPSTGFVSDTSVFQIGYRNISSGFTNFAQAHAIDSILTIPDQKRCTPLEVAIKNLYNAVHAANGGNMSGMQLKFFFFRKDYV